MLGGKRMQDVVKMPDHVPLVVLTFALTLVYEFMRLGQ